MAAGLQAGRPRGAAAAGTVVCAQRRADSARISAHSHNRTGGGGASLALTVKARALPRALLRAFGERRFGRVEDATAGFVRAVALG